MSRYRAEIFVFGSVILAATGQTLIKLGLSGQGFWMRSIEWTGVPSSRGVLVGLLIYGLGTLLWFAAVAKQSISYLYPLAATNYILMGLVGHFLLHEQMHALRWSGIMVMFVGIALLSGTSERQAAA